MTERVRHQMTRPELRTAHKAASEEVWRLKMTPMWRLWPWRRQWHRVRLARCEARRNAFFEALYGHTTPRATLPQEVSVISTQGCTTVSVALTNPEPVCADCGRDLPQDGNCGCANAALRGNEAVPSNGVVGGAS